MFSKMENDVNFLKMKDNLNFLKMEDDLNLKNDNLIIFVILKIS